MQWALPSGSPQLFMAWAVVLALGIGSIFVLMQLPPQFRKSVIAFVAFVSGLFFVLSWLWPRAQDHTPGDIPQNGMETISFWLQDATGDVGSLNTILAAFLLGLGALSILRIHGGRIMKRQQDWGFSAVTLISMFTIMIAGYAAWVTEKFPGEAQKNLDFSARENWNLALYSRDFLFDGVYQKMDGAMFSIIAFFIISAAYRAFRVRSIEATILLAAALIMMLSLLPMADLMSRNIIESVTGKDNPGHFANNFLFGELAGFIRSAFQQPSIRGIDFGIGIGALAMGIRLWLSLDKQGGGN